MGERGREQRTEREGREEGRKRVKGRGEERMEGEKERGRKERKDGRCLPKARTSHFGCKEQTAATARATTTTSKGAYKHTQLQCEQRRATSRSLGANFYPGSGGV